MHDVRGTCLEGQQRKGQMRVSVANEVKVCYGFDQVCVTYRAVPGQSGKPPIGTGGEDLQIALVRAFMSLHTMVYSGNLRCFSSRFTVYPYSAGIPVGGPQPHLASLQPSIFPRSAYYRIMRWKREREFRMRRCSTGGAVSRSKCAREFIIHNLRHKKTGEHVGPAGVTGGGAAVRWRVR